MVNKRDVYCRQLGVSWYTRITIPYGDSRNKLYYKREQDVTEEGQRKTAFG